MVASLPQPQYQLLESLQVLHTACWGSWCSGCKGSGSVGSLTGKAGALQCLAWDCLPAAHAAQNAAPTPETPPRSPPLLCAAPTCAQEAMRKVIKGVGGFDHAQVGMTKGREGRNACTVWWLTDV